MSDTILPNDPTLVSFDEYSDERLIEIHNAIKGEIEEREAMISLVRDELLDRAKKRPGTTIIGKEYTAARTVRVTFDISLEEARNKFGAVKEVVDNDILKGLDAKGVPIPGKKVSESITVRAIMKKQKGGEKQS